MTPSSSSSKPLIPLVVERRNRGLTLIRAETGVLIARLRPIARNDLVDILYRSLWKERWAPFGPFGRTAAPVEQAVRVIAEAFGALFSRCYPTKPLVNRNNAFFIEYLTPPCEE
jgi:hypothetical protein